MENKWYRVRDALSPLHGCDVRGERMVIVGTDFKQVPFMRVEALRRVDIFVGDRPFQLIAPKGQSLGLMIDWEQLVDSPLQDDSVELTTELPYGACVDEHLADRADGVSIDVVTYERRVQVALLKDGRLLASRTYGSFKVPDEIRELFEGGSSGDDLLEFMVGADGEEAE